MQVMLFDYYAGVKMEPSNLWVDMMYSIAEFKMMVLEELLRVTKNYPELVLQRFSFTHFL